MPDRLTGDPSPRSVAALADAIKSVEDKIHLETAAQKEAVRLLQDRADRQPTTEAVSHDLAALKELTGVEIAGLKELMKTMFEGNQTALAAALKTQDKTLDEIKSSFGKQFEGQAKTVDDLKDRITSSEGRGTGRTDSLGWIVAGITVLLSIVGVIVAILALKT